MTTVSTRFVLRCRRATQRSAAGVHTVTLLRHGESLWNVEKRYTGWCDIPLTSNGEMDAHDAGVLMGERGMKFDIAFTSSLERAWRTCDIALGAAGQSEVKTVQSWKLNERHYGAMQGHSKDSRRLNDVFGEATVIDWRRSYSSAPPSLYDPDFIMKMGLEGLRDSMSHVKEEFLDRKKINQLMTSQRPTMEEPSEYPSTESLKECEHRAYGYWNEVIAPHVRAGQRVLVVAHANTIRALVKAVDDIDDRKIAHLKIPNGIPLVYTLDDNLNPVTDLTDGKNSYNPLPLTHKYSCWLVRYLLSQPILSTHLIKSPSQPILSIHQDLGFQANYLVSSRNHGKVMAYERCVQKKLRSLFEYLDTDKDGRVTPLCLQSGLIRIQNNRPLKKRSSAMSEDEIDQLIPCEYEIEELLRCVPE